MTTATATVRGDAVGAVPTDDLGPSPLASLRPTGPSGVLDGGFELLRFRFRRLVGLAACFYVPIRLLDLVAMVTSGDAWETYYIGPMVFAAGGDSVWSWVVAASYPIALSILGLCVGHLVMRQLHGGDAPFRELLGVGLRRSWVAVLILPFAWLIKGLLSCIPLAFIVADALVFICSVVAGAEGLGPIRAWRRGMQLTRRSLGPMMGVVVGGLIISQLLRVSFSTGPMLLAFQLGASDAILSLIGQLGALVVLVAEPLTACIAARAYLELRCRHEGLDLRTRIVDRFGAGEPT